MSCSRAATSSSSSSRHRFARFLLVVPKAWIATRNAARQVQLSLREWQGKQELEGVLSVVIPVQHKSVIRYSLPFLWYLAASTLCFFQSAVFGKLLCTLLAHGLDLTIMTDAGGLAQSSQRSEGQLFGCT